MRLLPLNLFTYKLEVKPLFCSNEGKKLFLHKRILYAFLHLFICGQFWLLFPTWNISFLCFLIQNPSYQWKRFQLHEEQNYWSRSDDVWPSDTKVNGLELRKRLEVVEEQTWWPKLSRNLHLSATMWLWNVARKEGRRRPTMLPASNETVAMSHIWARGRKFELEAIINKLCQSGYVYTINSSPGFHHHLGKRHSTTIHVYQTNVYQSVHNKEYRITYRKRTNQM